MILTINEYISITSAEHDRLTISLNFLSPHFSKTDVGMPQSRLQCYRKRQPRYKPLEIL